MASEQVRFSDEDEGDVDQQAVSQIVPDTPPPPADAPQLAGNAANAAPRGSGQRPVAGLTPQAQQQFDALILNRVEQLFNELNKPRADNFEDQKQQILYAFSDEFKQNTVPTATA